MPAYQVLNDRTIYEPCLPDGSGHNDCIARAEDMKPCDCTCHLGVVVTTNKPPCADCGGDYAEHYTLGEVELACPGQQEDIDTYREAEA